jgi:hypothetical protein
MTAAIALAVALGCAACSQVPSAHSAVATTQSPTPSSSVPPPSGPLSAPKASVGQDGQFFTYVTEADPALATYEQQQGNVALRALLTDGTAFCAFLHRGGGVDNALVEVGAGARSDESQTHLPLSVTTFNAIESVALLTLCPSYQKLLPASARAKIRSLGQALASRPS